jgi:hypothetical protein
MVTKPVARRGTGGSTEHAHWDTPRRMRSAIISKSFSSFSTDVDAQLTPRQRTLLGVSSPLNQSGTARADLSAPSPLLRRTRSLDHAGASPPSNEARAAASSGRRMVGLDTDLTRTKKTIWIGGIPSLRASTNAVKLALSRVGEVTSVHVRAKDGVNKNW